MARRASVFILVFVFQVARAQTSHLHHFVFPIFFSSSVERDISRVSVANEWDIELNTRREILYIQATMYYCVYYINTKSHITETIFI